MHELIRAQIAFVQESLGYAFQADFMSDDSTEYNVAALRCLADMLENDYDDRLSVWIAECNAYGEGAPGERNFAYRYAGGEGVASAVMAAMIRVAPAIANEYDQDETGA